MNLFDDDRFLPHVYCLQARADLIWLHVASDTVIALSYFLIPVTLVVLLRKLKAPLSFDWAISLFAAFIVLCGTSHVFEIITLWEPMYYVQGLIKGVTAAVSALTAVAILPLVPKLLAMRSPEELEKINAQLQEQIAAREAVERELRQSVSELSHAMRELEQFAYIASHDLQAPLRAMSGFSQLLMTRHRGELRGEAVEFLDYIDADARHMQALIADLLELSRVGRSPDARLRTRPLAETVDAAVAPLAATVAESGAQIECPATLPRITADHALLTQLFANLIGNALKFQRPGVQPRVTVQAQHEGDHWHVIVADNGIGIPAEELDSVFDIFRRLHASTEYGGTGIGLAICRKIAEYHGGRIWATSDAGGSQFHLRLPIDPADRRASKPRRAAGVGAALPAQPSAPLPAPG